MEEKINQRIAWIEQRVELSELAKEYIAFQMMQFAKYYHEQQVKSVDLANVVCLADMTEETPNLGDLILVRFPPKQRTRPVIIEFDELFEWIDGTQYIRL